LSTNEAAIIITVYNVRIMFIFLPGDAFPAGGERNIIVQALRHVFLFFFTF
jgi:hypothetical protein